MIILITTPPRSAPWGPSRGPTQGRSRGRGAPEAHPGEPGATDRGTRAEVCTRGPLRAEQHVRTAPRLEAPSCRAAHATRASACEDPLCSLRTSAAYIATAAVAVATPPPPAPARGRVTPPPGWGLARAEGRPVVEDGAQRGAVRRGERHAVQERVCEPGSPALEIPFRSPCHRSW